MLAPHPPGGLHHRGYSGLGVEKVSQNVFDAETIAALRSVPDCKESYEIGNVSDATQPNIWLPDGSWKDGEEFKRYVYFKKGLIVSILVYIDAEKLIWTLLCRFMQTTFFHSCSTLVHQLLRAMATALALPSEDQLSKTHAQSLFQIRLAHYPPIATSILRKGEKSRIGAHSDFGTLTLLFQDSVGGLEVEDPSSPGSFRPAPPIPGTVLVNIGDLMERWSNGRWRSTVHRVVAPPIDEARSKREGEEFAKARYSIPFFASADPQTVIEVLPGCSGEQKPAKYGKTTALEYVQMRLAATY